MGVPHRLLVGETLVRLTPASAYRDHPFGFEGDEGVSGANHRLDLGHPRLEMEKDVDWESESIHE